MRPEIPSSLEERINRVHEEAGYSTGSELVREAVRRWVDTLERRFLDESRPAQPNFEFNVSSNASVVRLTLRPTEESDIRISNTGGDHESIPTLHTGTTMIENSTLKPALEQIDDVETGWLTHTGEIEVKFDRGESSDLQRAVDEIFRVIRNVIQEKEDPGSRVEQAAARYARREKK